MALNATYLQTGTGLGAGAGDLPAIILSISLAAIMRQRVLAWGMGW